jgi:hypothetical protein
MACAALRPVSPPAQRSQWHAIAHGPGGPTVEGHGSDPAAALSDLIDQVGTAWLLRLGVDRSEEQACAHRVAFSVPSNVPLKPAGIHRSWPHPPYQPYSVGLHRRLAAIPVFGTSGVIARMCLLRTPGVDCACRRIGGEPQTHLRTWASDPSPSESGHQTHRGCEHHTHPDFSANRGRSNGLVEHEIGERGGSHGLRTSDQQVGGSSPSGRAIPPSRTWDDVVVSLEARMNKTCRFVRGVRSGRLGHGR